MTDIEFYFDFVSPYSHLAFDRVHELGAPVALSPVPVLDLMTRVGNAPTSVTCAAKRAYVGQDLARWVKRTGVPFTRPDFARLDCDLLLSVALAAQAQGVGRPVSRAIFAAVWGGVGDAAPDGLPDLLAQAGAPAESLLADARSEGAHRRTMAVEAAAAAGVFGVPSFRVGGELFFGNDRLDFVREAVAAATETK